MTVWIENPFDNLPREGGRPMRFWLVACAFAAAGHRVLYWTSSFNHTLKAPRRLPASFEAEGVSVRLVPTPPYKSNVGLARIRSHAAYARAWERLARDPSLPRPDVLVVSSPPLATGPVARRLARRFGAKLVVDVMDAWPETFYRLLPGPLRTLAPLLFAPLLRTVRADMRGADLVIGVSQRYCDRARRMGARNDLRLSHATPLPVAEPAGPDAPPRLALVYVGAMGKTYDLGTILRALLLVPEATLDLAGAGCREPSLKAFVRAHGLAGRVRFHGYLPAPEVSALLARSTVGLIPMRADSCVGIPNKLVDYSAAGLAVASSLAGESADLLARYGAGVSYEAGSPESLAQSLRTIPPRLPEMRAGARRLAREQFDAAKTASAYVQAVERLVAP